MMTRKEREEHFNKAKFTAKEKSKSFFANKPALYGVGAGAGLWILGMTVLPAAVLGGIVAVATVVVPKYLKESEQK